MGLSRGPRCVPRPGFAGEADLLTAIEGLAAIGHWWILIPVMTVDFAVTTAVLATVVRLTAVARTTRATIKTADAVKTSSKLIP